MTAVRAMFEQKVLPAFAARFRSSNVVLNLGAGRHAYREAFPCRVITADKNPVAGCDETFPAEAIPYPDESIDGVLLMGVVERLDDPMEAMREIFRVVKPGGLACMSILDLAFPWRKPGDRWRLSVGGAEHLVRDFTVLERRRVETLAQFFILQKPGGPA